MTFHRYILIILFGLRNVNQQPLGGEILKMLYVMRKSQSTVEINNQFMVYISDVCSYFRLFNQKYYLNLIRILKSHTYHE